MKGKKRSVLVALSLLFILSCQGQTDNSSWRLIELVTLNEGYNLEDHLDYGKKIDRILGKYNMQNVANFQILKKFKGGTPDHAVKVGLFELDSPESLKGVFGDKEYNEKFVPQRNQIHDMSGMTFFMAKPVLEKPYDKNKTIVMDFVVMSEGYGKKERDDYFDKLVNKYGKKHGLKLVASYEVIQFMRGIGPKGTSMINFYEVEANTIPDITNDRGYQKKMVPIRDEIFDSLELAVLMTQPIQ